MPGELIYDEEKKTYRPRYQARVRVAGERAPSAKPPPGEGELVEVYEGGRFIGYERTRPQKKYLPGIGD